MRVDAFKKLDETMHMLQVNLFQPRSICFNQGQFLFNLGQFDVTVKLICI